VSRPSKVSTRRLSPARNVLVAKCEGVSTCVASCPAIPPSLSRPPVRRTLRSVKSSATPSIIITPPLAESVVIAAGSSSPPDGEMLNPLVERRLTETAPCARSLPPEADAAMSVVLNAPVSARALSVSGPLPLRVTMLITPPIAPVP